MPTTLKARRRRRRVTALVTATASACGMMIVAASPSFAAPTCYNGNERCYAITPWGSVAGTNAPSNGSNVDLDIYGCLSVGNRVTDFANWESWQLTNGDLAEASYWVEAGMTAGTVVDGGQTYIGFLQFWADSRPNGGGYNEHLGPNTGFLNRYFPVNFAWAGNGNWKVSIDGVLAGTSTANGGNSYGGEAGAEVTTKDATIAAELDNYSWITTYNATVKVNPDLFIQAPSGWFSAYSQVAPGGAYTNVTTGCGSSAAVVNAELNAHEKPITAAEAPSVLRATALKIAAMNGEANPTGVAYVAGTRTQGVALTNSAVTQDGPSYIVEMHGHFTSYRGGPIGRNGQSYDPTGNTMIVVVSTATGMVTDTSIFNSDNTNASLLSHIAEPNAL
jgi:hypothetical protein